MQWLIKPKISNHLYKITNRAVMASSKEYLKFVLEQLSEMEEITCKTMMGEYLLYYRGKIV